jgi:hypothetical protein
LTQQKSQDQRSPERFAGISDNVVYHAAARKVGRLVGIEVDGGLDHASEAARNIILGMVDRHNEAHLIMLGGVAIDAGLRVTFWSSPHTEHAKLIRDGRRASVLISHTHEPNTALRMKQMHVEEVAPEDAAVHLAELNAARKIHGLHIRGLEEFKNNEAPKSLYVATPSDDPLMTTVPVSAYAQRKRGLSECAACPILSRLQKYLVMNV